MLTNLLDTLSTEYKNKKSEHVPQNFNSSSSLNHYSDSLKLVYNISHIKAN